ncbi:RICIN domain-containing protein [Streptomyces beigongshangae]|uniref:NHL domain-containing protein n=1 Tax=Streptomyces beigongshangae TaxID=2841597 RepID=UPI001C85E1EB|nr:RICIN domain-containing protein [Streptomyces sp. REN17]
MSTAQAGVAGDGDSARPIGTFAGTGTAGAPRGDKEPARSAQLTGPYGVAVDRDGTLYLSEYGGHRIRKVTTDGQSSTVAGTGSAGRGAEGVPAVSAPLHTPRGIIVDSAGDLYIADSGNNRIRKITKADGKIHTVAGTGAATYGGDGLAATAAHLNHPMGVAVDSAGDLYIADYNNHRIRKITKADGKISTVVGTSSAGLAPDGTLATAAQLRNPTAVAVDSAGDLYIADHGNHRVRKVTKADQKISTVAGTGTATYVRDGVQAVSAPLSSPMGVVVDSTDTLYIADTNNHRVREVAADGTIGTVAGTGTAGPEGDDGPAVKAQLKSPHGLAVDCVDTLYIADYANNRVRKVASVKMAGLPDSGTVVFWANVRSRLRMAVVSESTKDGAEVHQSLAVPRDHQRWRLVPAGRDDGDILYRIENVRSGKVLEVVGAQERSGAVVAQRTCEGAEARHQQWRLVPVGSGTGTPRVYEIANHNSGLLLRVDTNARAVIKQDGSEGDHRARQWQLLPG